MFCFLWVACLSATRYFLRELVATPVLHLPIPFFFAAHILPIVTGIETDHAPPQFRLELAPPDRVMSACACGISCSVSVRVEDFDFFLTNSYYP